MNADVATLHLKKDRALQAIIENTTITPLVPSGQVYFELLESIVSQQLSVKAASTIFKRFCTLFPDEYPHPEVLQSIDHHLLRSAGLSNQKATYLKNVAVFAMENDLEHYSWNNLSDKEIIAFLTQIKGVGQWTVEMVLIFTLDRPDIWPVDDLGIRQAMIRLFSLQESGTALQQRMTALAEPWRPYRSLASRYLWRWKDS